MPGPKEVITVRGDRKMAYACDRKSLELVDELSNRNTNLPSTEVKHSRPNMAPKPSDQTKEVSLDKDASSESVEASFGLENASATFQKILVGAGLDPK